MQTCIRKEQTIGPFCFPFTICCFLGPCLVIPTSSKSFSLKFFNHCRMFFCAIPNCLSAGQTPSCLAHRMCCFDLSMLHEPEGSSNIVLCTNRDEAFHQGSHLTHAQHTCVSGCANLFQQFRWHLKIILKSKGTCNWNGKIIVSPWWCLDWGWHLY